MEALEITVENDRVELCDYRCCTVKDITDGKVCPFDYTPEKNK